ncbi:MAG: hypothetical protein J0G35_06520 [Acidobacteriales bacterium]|nr:hypothetical protein [Terriglobales bacterium]
MSTLQRSCSLYEILLFAYPSEFRQHFSDEMKETFVYQMRRERGRSGLAGAFRVWSLVFWELLSVAVPLQLQNSIVIATAASLLGSSGLSILFFRAVAHHCSK